jgi:hypothetical protein
VFLEHREILRLGQVHGLEAHFAQGHTEFLEGNVSVAQFAGGLVNAVFQWTGRGLIFSGFSGVCGKGCRTQHGGSGGKAAQSGSAGNGILAMFHSFSRVYKDHQNMIGINTHHSAPPFTIFQPWTSAVSKILAKSTRFGYYAARS